MFTGQLPSNRRVALTVLGLCGFMPMAVHQAKGGSHALTHSLVKCFVSNGGEIWTTCPVSKILVEAGKACGIRLSDDALMPGAEIRAKNIVSNLSFQPTFRDLLGEEVIGPEWMRRVKFFNYDDPQLMLDRTPIPVVAETKFLGLIFDNKLSFVHPQHKPPFLLAILLMD